MISTTAQASTLCLTLSQYEYAVNHTVRRHKQRRTVEALPEPPKIHASEEEQTPPAINQNDEHVRDHLKTVLDTRNDSPHTTNIRLPSPRLSHEELAAQLFPESESEVPGQDEPMPDVLEDEPAEEQLDEQLIDRLEDVTITTDFDSASVSAASTISTPPTSEVEVVREVVRRIVSPQRLPRSSGHSSKKFAQKPARRLTIIRGEAARDDVERSASSSPSEPRDDDDPIESQSVQSSIRKRRTRSPGAPSPDRRRKIPLHAPAPRFQLPIRGRTSHQVSDWRPGDGFEPIERHIAQRHWRKSKTRFPRTAKLRYTNALTLVMGDSKIPIDPESLTSLNDQRSLRSHTPTVDLMHSAAQKSAQRPGNSILKRPAERESTASNFTDGGSNRESERSHNFAITTPGRRPSRPLVVSSGRSAHESRQGSADTSSGVTGLDTQINRQSSPPAKSRNFLTPGNLARLRQQLSQSQNDEEIQFTPTPARSVRPTQLLPPMFGDFSSFRARAKMFDDDRQAVSGASVTQAMNKGTGQSQDSWGTLAPNIDLSGTRLTAQSGQASAVRYKESAISMHLPFRSSQRS